jgi:hypothetical protein
MAFPVRYSMRLAQDKAAWGLLLSFGSGISLAKNAQYYLQLANWQTPKGPRRLFVMINTSRK